MNLSCRTFASGNAWPCDLDVSVDPIVAASACFAVAVVGLGFLALIYLLAKGRS